MVLQDMQRSGVQPDDVTYSTVIQACVKGGEWERALKVLAAMQRAGGRLNSSMVSTFPSAAPRHTPHSRAAPPTQDYDRARPFCKKTKVKFVPCGQIYSGGALQAALPLGKKKWDEFKTTLNDCRDAIGQ